MTKKSDYFQFRFEPEFAERVNEMIRLGEAENFSHALRKFTDIGIELSKIHCKNETIIEKIIESLKFREPHTEEALNQIISDICSAHSNWDALKFLSDFELYKITKVILNELIKKEWAIHLKKIILELDVAIDSKDRVGWKLENVLMSTHYIDKENRKKVKQTKCYSFGVLDELKKEEMKEMATKLDRIITKDEEDSSIENSKLVSK